MSATNRGGKRTEADYYPTPAWCVHRLLEYVPLPGGTWLEPAAGSGAIVRAVNSLRSDVRWHAVELERRHRPILEKVVGRRAVVIDSFMSLLPGSFPKKVSVVITNPPYSVAMPIIEHALRFDASFVVMLLRLNFLASGGRATFMREHAPDVYVLPNRPSFSGSGTDSIEYAWFVWHGTRKRRQGAVHVLPETPVRERQGLAARTRHRGSG